MKYRIGTVMLLLPALVWAHGDEHHSVWSREAALLTPLLIFGAWYALGLMRVRIRARASGTAQWRNTALFVGGWLTIALSLLSPLHALGGRSFTAHMTEHELLMLLAAPLIALSRPLAIFLWALPDGLRRSAVALARRRWFHGSWRYLSHPLTTTTLQIAVLWIWHAPQLFDLALRYEGWHALQHLSFLLSALLFWWSITRGPRTQHHRATAAVYLFITSLLTGALGALMAISASPWYAGYAALGLEGLLPGQLTAAEDQQLAGLVMWIPGGLVHFVAALVFARGALQRTISAEPGHALRAN